MLAVSLIIAGGIGNLIDRVFNNGQVVDFIDFRIINFPVFNFADICAVCGAIILMIVVVVDEIREKKHKKTVDNAENNSDDTNN